VSKGDDLVRAIRTVGKGESLLDPAVTSGCSRPAQTGKRLLKDEKLARLSPRYHERPVEWGPDGSRASVVRVRR